MMSATGTGRRASLSLGSAPNAGTNGDNSTGSPSVGNAGPSGGGVMGTQSMAVRPRRGSVSGALETVDSTTSIPVSGKRMSVGALGKTLTYVNRAKAGLRRGSYLSSPDSDLESSSEDEEMQKPDAERDRSDPAVFRAFLKKRCSTLSRAWNLMCGKNQGRSFATWSEAKSQERRVGDTSKSCRTNNSRTFSYDEFEEILIDRMKYTTEKSVVLSLFRNLDDDNSQTISIDEVRPDRKTNFFLAAFIEAILKPVMVKMVYGGNPVVQGGMTYLKLLLFLAHMKRVVIKKAKELRSGGLTPEQILSPAFEPTTSDEEEEREWMKRKMSASSFTSGVSPSNRKSTQKQDQDAPGNSAAATSNALAGAAEKVTRSTSGESSNTLNEGTEGAERPKAVQWTPNRRSGRKVTDKYFRQDKELKSLATRKEQTYAASKVSRLRASLLKLKNFNWEDPAMVDSRLHADPVMNNRKPHAPRDLIHKDQGIHDRYHELSRQLVISSSSDSKTSLSGVSSMTSPAISGITVSVGSRSSAGPPKVCGYCGHTISKAGWGNLFCICCSCCTEAINKGIYPLLPLFHSNCTASPLFTEQIAPSRADVWRSQSTAKPRISTIEGHF
ncbi:unnamed protein product [Amoebophrya sp. A25]|nr:unnamed protein product [Amoebophrya sp. A25]|eukprot:GSA25T00025606001.1